MHLIFLWFLLHIYQVKKYFISWLFASYHFVQYFKSWHLSHNDVEIMGRGNLAPIFHSLYHIFTHIHAMVPIYTKM